MAVTPRRLSSLLLVAFAACAKHEPPRGLGVRVAEGEVRSLRASADGAFLAFLDRCAPLKDRALPPETAACDLFVVPTAGGRPERVARGVSTLPSGFAWGGAGHVLLALDGYDPAAGKGALTIWSGSGSRKLAEDVTFFAVDGSGTRVGWVAAGRLTIAPVGAGEPVIAASAEDVATFEFGPQGSALARKISRAGGDLIHVSGRTASPVTGAVRDYSFAPSGGRYAFTGGPVGALGVMSGAAGTLSWPIGRDVKRFTFAPSGAAIAFIADAKLGQQGDLWLAMLPSAGGSALQPVLLGKRVDDPRWSKNGARLVWLQDYQPGGRTGQLVAMAPGGKPVRVANHVSDFDLASDGSAVAFLLHETSGGYSVDLGLATLGEQVAPVKISRGVFGFSFSPDARWLYYRSACIREAEACDLSRVKVGEKGPRPERLVEGVKSFEYAPGLPERLLVSWARKDRIALDLGIWERGRVTSVDTHALPGSVQFVAGNPRKLAYAVIDRKRQGVYVADIP